MKEELKKIKGITLIALVVTIIVLLILSAVTITLTMGEDGIITKASQTKDEAEIATEKEIVILSATNSMSRNEDMVLIEGEFQDSIDGYTGEGKTTVTDMGNEFEVVFLEKNRYYKVDKDGNLIEGGEVVQDKSPGDITVGKDGEILDGSEEHPYEIWCIEDLVAFSNMVNGTGYIYKEGSLQQVNAPNSFQNKYISLKRDLNFKSTISYANSKRTDFGDINGNTEDGNEIMKEMITGTGFRPIGIHSNIAKTFNGNFDGETNILENIYINYANEENKLYGTGVFGLGGSKVSIKNLSVSGEMKGGQSGGIVGCVYTAGSEDVAIIENCINYANITGYNMVGGICGLTGGKLKIKNCINYGELKIRGKSYAYAGIGGIIGCNNEKSEIELTNCINLGNIDDIDIDIQIGGIIGTVAGKKIFIDSCINKGNLLLEKNSGGIIRMAKFRKCNCTKFI